MGKSAAKAKAKTMRTEALRFRGSLLASAQKEAQQMREQALQEVEELRCMVSKVSPELDRLECKEPYQQQAVDTVLTPLALQQPDDDQEVNKHVGEQQSDQDDGAFESANEWEFLNETTAKVDDEDDSWVIG